MSLMRRVGYDGALQRKITVGDNDLFTRDLNQAQTADAASVITAAAIVGGFYKRSGQTAGRIDTTDTGVNIDAADNDLDIGESFSMIVSNQAAQILTIAGGVGVTITSAKTTVPASASGVLIFTKTGAGTYNLYIQ